MESTSASRTERITRRPRVPRAEAWSTGLRRSRELGGYISGALSRRWRTYIRELERCRTGFSEAAVHDLRVSIRRLLSAIELASVVVKDGREPRLQRDLRKLLKSFGPLRDVQVQLIMTGPLLEKYPKLESLNTILRLRERRLIKQLRKRILGVRTVRHSSILERLKTRAVKIPGDRAGASAGSAAVIAATAAAYSAAVNLRESVDPLDTGTVHRLRIAFKKFRYKVEAIEPLLPWLTEERLTAMNAYQTRMGEVQDLEVYGALIMTVASRRGVSSEDPVPAVSKEVHRRLKDAMETFLASADELYSFWPAGRTGPTECRRSR